jgi:hypothetical protein
MPNSNPSPSLLAPIAGAFHRPPAKQVLQALPSGAKLILQPEPENPWDALAVKVLVDVGDAITIQQFPGLQAALDGTGVEAHELISSHEPLQLGYIAASQGKPLAKAKAAGFPGVGNAEVLAALEGHWANAQATLEFWVDGSPCVRVTPAVESDYDAA